MVPTATAQDRPHTIQTYSETDKRLSSGNALKHGLRSAAILLPDDDPAEFSRLRQDLFHTYRPRTVDEAACVEAMASQQWRIARCRRWQAVYDALHDALLTGDPNGLAGHICETDPHRWMHKAMDCTLQESRLDRLLCRTRDKLLLLQKLRRNNLIAGAVEREPICWPAASPADLEVSPPQDRGWEGNPPARPRAADGFGGSDAGPTAPASPSSDGEMGKSGERNARPLPGAPRLSEAASEAGGAIPPRSAGGSAHGSRRPASPPAS